MKVSQPRVSRLCGRSPDLHLQRGLESDLNYGSNAFSPNYDREAVVMETRPTSKANNKFEIVKVIGKPVN